MIKASQTVGRPGQQGVMKGFPKLTVYVGGAHRGVGWDVNRWVNGG